MTAIGIKPICPCHQVFQSTYLYGAFSPLDGNKFLLELPYCNTDCFEVFLSEFSKHNPEELIVIILDNGAFHKAKRLVIPHNVILIFLPPYSPELNPAEKVWAKFKRDFTNRFFDNMEALRDYVCNLSQELTANEVKSISRFSYIFSNPYWTII